jgi:hypothetical protein
MTLAARFDGSVVRLGAVNVTDVRTWIDAIPFEAWPQQTPNSDGALRPAMVNDRAWHNFGAITDRLVVDVLSNMTSGGVELQRLLSVVMPGHVIDPHVDKVSLRWWGRIHVPLTSAPESRFIVAGRAQHLAPGWAYLVNVTKEHSVVNAGATPRIHLMVDVGVRT